MKNLIDFFIDRPLLVNLFTVLVIIIGFISLTLLKKETFPPIEFDVVLITTAYPGSSAEDVEKLVTIPIERKLKGVAGIKKMNALSAENSSIIYLEVEADNDIDEVLTDIKNEVDTVNDLPSEVEKPIIKSLNNRFRGIIKIALTGGTYNELRKTSKRLRDRIERIPGIADITLEGYQVDEIRVELNLEKINGFELTTSDVYEALRARNLNLSGGSIKSSDGELFVRTVAEFESLEDVKNVVVRSNTSGSNIHVKDIAEVTRKPAEGTVLQRANGVRAVFLDVKTQENADILGITGKLKKATEKFFDNPQFEKFKFHYTDDSSYYVVRRLNVLKDNGLIGMFLVFVCLLFFLNLRTSIITSLGAPIAFMVAFVVMGMTGVSLNLISMFALILVLGMLVDDSIIVSEHFYQKLEKGMDPKPAAREASLETMKPVTTTVLTTIVAFGSLFFMGGIMGKFLWSVPAVVVICLLASLFECYFILPSHLAEFCKIKPNQKKKIWYEKLSAFYGKTLSKAIKRPGIILFSFFLVWMGSIILAKKKMDFELFPGDDVRVLFVQLKGEVGSAFETTNETVRKVERFSLEVLKKEELDQLRSQVGVLMGEHGNKRGDHYGSLIIYLTPPGDRARSTDEIIEAIVEPAKKLIPNYQLTISKVQQGPPKGKPVEIELMGESIDELKQVALEIQNTLEQQTGVTSTEVDFEEGKEQIIVRVNEEEAKRLGLSTRVVALEIRRLLSGESITEVRESDEDIEVKIFPDPLNRSKIDILSRVFINNNQGRRIPLMKVVEIERSPGAFVIRRLNRRRVMAVSGSLDKSKMTPVKITEIMKPEVNKILKKYPDVDAVFGGENKDTKESMMRLSKSALIAVSCIFLILVLMFNNFAYPLVVMSAIPLGLIGVIWAFYVAGQALGFMAMMGVVALVGVVVNDSIVLVNFINKKREEYDDLPTAIVEASKSRFRAVILTTFTTVVGLMPIAHPIVARVLSFGVNTDSDPFLQPMALSFAWGLLFASMVTLFFIPCNYYMITKIKSFSKRIFNFRFKKFNLKRKREFSHN